MDGRTGNQSGALKMQAGGARAGAPDVGEGMARFLGDAELQAAKHYVKPAVVDGADSARQYNLARDGGAGAPYWMGNYDGVAVPYSAPSELKEAMALRQHVHEAAGQAIKQVGAEDAVVRTDPISETEIAYLKSMKDQAELAQFDKYVESLIDPRMPGNMKWLMEVYPDYVNRRLQQAHTDYEFALRNQMIDSWGINTFDDLHFKYLVDQGKVSGPNLANEVAVDARYTPGYLSWFNFQRPATGSTMYLPYASAMHGRRYNRTQANLDRHSIDRSAMPLGSGNNYRDLATGMYGGPIGQGPRQPARYAQPAAAGPGMRA